VGNLLDLNSAGTTFGLDDLAYFAIHLVDDCVVRVAQVDRKQDLPWYHGRRIWGNLKQAHCEFDIVRTSGRAIDFGDHADSGH